MKKAIFGTFWCLAVIAGCESLPRTQGVPGSPSSMASLPAISQTSAGPSPVAVPQETTSPFDGTAELSVEAVVQQVLARNPSVAQMMAAWEAVSARYPQVTALDDPMVEAVLAPASIGSNDVEFGGRLAISQKLPWPGKRQARGDAALAEANAAAYDVDELRLQLSESARHAFYDYYFTERALEVNQQGL